MYTYKFDTHPYVHNMKLKSITISVTIKQLEQTHKSRLIAATDSNFSRGFVLLE